MDKREERIQRAAHLSSILGEDEHLAARFRAVNAFSTSVRATEYHLTNACNIRCKGCWFFEYGHDKVAKEARALSDFQDFIKRERARKINCAILIGGEPTMFPDRIAAFVEGMRYVTISTNGLKKLPNEEPFKNVAVMVSLFGGGKIDDELRAIKPSGRTFTGLFDTALGHYEGDTRANFVFAVTERGMPHIEETVERIARNGNTVTFNFYSEYNSDNPLRMINQRLLLKELTRVKAMYPQTVINHDRHISALITGKSTWGDEFGYQTCPSLSFDHPQHKERRANGNPTLPLFNTFKADLKTLELCCTSGHCDGCRDSQAVYSWLMVSLNHFLTSKEDLRQWVEMAETYWAQFAWSPYRRKPGVQTAVQPAQGATPAATDEFAAA